MIVDNILQAVGNTPVVRLNRVGDTLPAGTTLYGKCEFLNPGGSTKDRIAVRMVERECEFTEFTIYRMRVFDGMSGKDVAESVGTSEPTVSRRLTKVRDLLRRRDCGQKFWSKQPAPGDRDDGIGGAPVQPDDRTLLRPPPRKNGAPARSLGRGRDAANGGRQALSVQRGAHDLLLPGGDETVRGMHQDASAAGAVVGAGGFHPVGRSGDDPGRGHPVAHDLPFHDLAGQGPRDIDRAGGNPVNEMAKPFDGQPHSAASSSVPRKPPDWRFQ